MAENEVELGVGVDLSGASPAIQKFSKDIGEAIADLRQLANFAENHINRLTKKLNDGFTKAPLFSEERMAFGRKIERMRSQGYSAIGKDISMGMGLGGPADTARNEALVRQRLLQINNSYEQAEARIAQARLGAFKRAAQSTEPYLLASAARVERNAAELVRRENNSPLLAAQATRTRNQEARLIREAQVGPEQAAMEGTLRRLNTNGGANLAAIQTKVLVGYQAISASFNALKGGANFVVQLDKQLHQFQAITATTNKEMESLEKRLISVSEKTKFTALEVASAATIMGQAGLSAAEVATSIEAVTLLATAAGTELAPAVDLVTSTLSIFNLQTSQTADIANTMTAAINGSKLTIDKLALGFQYAGNIAAQAGLTYTELTATLGALANSGIKSGSTLGTGLRQLLVDLQTPTEKFSTRLRQLGLVQADVDIKSRGLVAVLKTLKEAGFGGAEAFESFEVRAAASFTALSNNLEVVGQLEKQFVLSNAAAEANTIQMDSLANTFAKLTSVMGTVIYNAFKPFMEILQGFADRLADTLSLLNKVPGLLQLISIALVATGVGVTASAFSALFRALASGLPLFATYTAATSSLVVANTAAAVSTTAFSRVLTGLFAVMRAHPFVLGITAVAALGTAFRIFRKDAEDLLEVQKAVISTLEGEIETQRNKAEAIDQTVANLIQRKSELDKDPILREAKLLEVIQQFKELGGQIDATTSSVQDLIDALGNIKEISFGEQIDLLDSKLAAIAANLALIKAEQTQQADAVRPELGGVIRRQLKGKLGAGEQAQLGGSYGAARQRDLIIDGFRYLFPGDKHVDFGAQVATGALQNQTASSIHGALGNITNDLRKMESELRVLQITGASKSQQSPLLNGIEALSALSEELRIKLQLATEFEKLEGEQALTKLEAARTSAKAALEANGLAQEAVNSQTLYTQLVEEAERYSQQKTTSVAEAAKSAEHLKDSFDAFETSLKVSLDAWKDVYLRANPNVSPETVEAAIQQTLTDNRAQLENRINDLAIKTGKNLAELNETQLEAYGKTLDKAIQTRMKTISGTTSRDDLKQVEGWVKKRMEEKRELVTKIYDEKIAQETTNLGIEKLEGQKAEALAQIDEHQTNLLDSLNDQMIKLTEKLYKQGIDAADRDIDVLTKNLKDVEGEIKKAKPGEMMDKLIRKYNEMAGALADALDSKETLQLGLGSYDSPASDRSTYLNKVVGAESGGKLHARNPDSSAGGLGQFTDGTWLAMMSKHYPGLVRSKSKQQLLAMKYNRDFHMQVLDQFTQDNEAGLGKAGVPITDGSRYLAHFLGLGGASKVLRAEPGTPIEQVTGADQRAANKSVFKGVNTAGDLVAWANKKMGGTAKTNASATAQEVKEDLANAVYEGTTRAVKAEVAANVKANRAQIAGRTAISGIVGDPSTIASNMNEVDAMFDRILAERVREFEQVNMKALAAGDEETKAQLADLKDQINSERSTKLSGLVDDYQKAAEDVVSKPLEEARAKLAAARDPANRGKFSIPEINKLEADVKFLEREQAANAVTVAEKKLVLVRGELAEATKRSGANSEEAITWLQREAQANKELEEALKAVGIQKDANNKGPMTQQDAFAGAVQNWQLNSGFMKMGKDGMPEMLSAAEQMETVWGNVLETLSTGFGQFFKDLASGTMSAGEAFKNFALTVIQSFIDMIAKALAFQMVQQMIGMAGSAGGGTLGTILSGIFTVPGAANGEMISGGVPNRDSVLRRVMPGEAILRKSAVDAIGADTLLGLNNMGNRRISTTAPEAMGGEGGSGMVNVYVVSPDAVPPLGPNDIVATIMDDANRKGPIRQLIKSVQMGVV